MRFNHHNISNLVGGKRLRYIDLLKGFGIVLMVAGHMHYNDFIEKFIYGFHMPLFFFLSGYLHHTPKNMFQYIQRKARTLLLPYFIMGIFYIIIDVMIHGSVVLRKDIIGVFIKTTDWLPLESALWFLVALFWVCCLYSILERYVKNIGIRTLVVFIISMIGCKWTEYLFVLPWGINSAMAALGFYYLGNCFKLYEEDIMVSLKVRNVSSIVKRIIVILFVISGTIIIFNEKVNMRVGYYGNAALAYLAATIFSILLLIIFRWLELELQKHKMQQILSVLVDIGRYSIIYVCVNHLALELAKYILVFLGTSSIGELAIILEFMIAMVIMLIIASIVRGTFLRKIFFCKKI